MDGHRKKYPIQTRCICRYICHCQVNHVFCLSLSLFSCYTPENGQPDPKDDGLEEEFPASTIWGFLFVHLSFLGCKSINIPPNWKQKMSHTCQGLNSIGDKLMPPFIGDHNEHINPLVLSLWPSPIIWVFPEIDVPPNHPFWGTTIFGNTHNKNIKTNGSSSTRSHISPQVQLWGWQWKQRQ